MNLEQQVINIDLAKKLKELGIKQDSLYNWIVLDKAHVLYSIHKITSHQEELKQKENGILIVEKNYHEKLSDEFIHYSAFTATELGELLKMGYPDKKVWTYWNGEYWQSWAHDCNLYADKEADMRAMMLIDLIEKKLYDPQTQMPIRC